MDDSVTSWQNVYCFGFPRYKATNHHSTSVAGQRHIGAEVSGDCWYSIWHDLPQIALTYKSWRSVPCKVHLNKFQIGKQEKWWKKRDGWKTACGHPSDKVDSMWDLQSMVPFTLCLLGTERVLMSASSLIQFAHCFLEQQKQQFFSYSVWFK